MAADIYPTRPGVQMVIYPTRPGVQMVISCVLHLQEPFVTTDYISVAFTAALLTPRKKPVRYIDCRYLIRLTVINVIFIVTFVTISTSLICFR
jgi:hypothetical protein